MARKTAGGDDSRTRNMWIGALAAAALPAMIGIGSLVAPEVPDRAAAAARREAAIERLRQRTMDAREQSDRAQVMEAHRRLRSFDRPRDGG